jgi:acid stress-induced BolA-like protein IbaG/YrbA
MDSQEIQNLLAAALPECQVAVAGGGGKFQVTAVGDVFAGLSAVRRQQKIYQVLNEHISSGAIHAVSMNIMSTEESVAAS